jgi:hypothetical protein
MTKKADISKVAGRTFENWNNVRKEMRMTESHVEQQMGGGDDDDDNLPDFTASPLRPSGSDLHSQACNKHINTCYSQRQGIQLERTDL